ncbi:MAG: hypothetical protein M3O70_18315 [Actinomycetota bacterium]|nr:hypothetical protein [Actinomycetota bacterium]
MWQLNHGGRVYRWDALTLAQLAEIERLAGASWPEVSPWRSARHAIAIGTVLLGSREEAGRVTLREWSEAPDDIPELWVDGQPQDGSVEDRWLVSLCPPFTPAQVRHEFRYRDLMLMAAAQPPSKEHR